VESADYIAMTLDALNTFSLEVSCLSHKYSISGGATLRSPGEVSVEGDWSNAAFWLCAGALPGGAIRCRGLHPESRQGDKAIRNILEAMGAHLVWEDQDLLVFEGTRQGVEIDASPIPDLVPAISCLAAVSEGETYIKNAGRLRLKESDRLSAVTQTLRTLGAEVTEETDALRILGVPRLQGGGVDAWGDHRIAMMAAIAAAACQGPVTISGAEAVRKSYPSFWEVLFSLGVAQKEEVL
jgi:3-phosphoshikimate 1-carboxyvinyltransferase